MYECVFLFPHFNFAAGTPWALWNGLCVFNKIMDLHWGDKKRALPFRWKEAGCCLESWGIIPLFHVERYHGQADWCGLKPAMHYNTKPRSSTFSVSLCLSPPVRGRFVQEKVRWNVKSRVIALEREILINALSCLFSYRLPIWIFHLILLASPPRTQLHSQSQQKDRRIQCMQRSKNKQFGYEWQTLSRGWRQTANQSLQD